MVGGTSLGGRAPYTQKVDEEKECCDKHLVRSKMLLTCHSLTRAYKTVLPVLYTMHVCMRVCVCVHMHVCTCIENQRQEGRVE